MTTCAKPYSVSPRTKRQLAELAKWWRANRRDARKSVRVAFSETIKKVVSDPGIGTLYEDVAGVRWVSMHSSMPYLIFYRQGARTGTIEVIAVWSGIRGEPPPIG